MNEQLARLAGDPMAALATLAQVYATFAALGSGFGALALQSLAKRGRYLEDTFFVLLQELGDIAGQPYTPQTLQSAKTYLNLTVFEGHGDDLARRVPSPPDGTPARHDVNRAIHAYMAWNRNKAHRAVLAKDKCWALALTIIPVALNGLGCIAALALLLAGIPLNRISSGKPPVLPGPVVLGGATGIILITVACAAWLLVRSARQNT